MKGTRVKRITTVHRVPLLTQCTQHEKECSSQHRSSLSDGCTDWQVITDLEHQHSLITKIMLTAQRRDIVIWSVNLRNVFVVVTFDENIDRVYQHKLEKYKNLWEQWIGNGWITNISYWRFRYILNLPIPD